MGIEGQVKLGYRAELEAVEDPEERRQLYEKLVAGLYESGKAINRTANFSLDEVIDPVDTRKWVVNLLASIRPPAPRDKKKRPIIDTW